MTTETSEQVHIRPATPRRWWLWLVVITATLAGLALYAYQQRITLFTNAADTLLQPYGLRVETLDGLQPGTTSLRINRLELIHHNSGALQSLSDIRVEFTVTGLLASRISSISIANAELTLPETSTSITGNGADAASGTQAMGDILAAIPFSQLSVARLQVTASELTTETILIQHLSADLGALVLDCQPDRCQLTSDLELSVDTLRYRTVPNTLDADTLTLDLVALDTPINLTLDARTNTVSLGAREALLTMPSIRAGGYLTGLVGNIRRIDLSYPLISQNFDPAGLYLQTELSVSELYTNLVDINLWTMQLNQHLTWQDGVVYTTGALFEENRRLMANDLNHNLALGSGQGTFEVPLIEFNDSNNKLSDLLSPLPWQGDILAGSASANINLNWLTSQGNPATVTGTVQASLNDLGGYVNEIAFLRLNTDFAAELLPDWHLRSTRPASFSLASLDAGIEVTNIHSRYTVNSEPASILLSDTSLELFGGTVSSEQLSYHLQDNDSHFTIVIDSIDLDRVLGMSAYQGVSATGLVSGNLPVHLQGLRPSISGGTLTAQQPGGTIRYGSGATEGGNQSLNLVYQALEHYRFDIMETQVDYQESGELDLAIRMEGISPELNGGQRINLNLNINDDIPALLQSLQAARSVTDSIQARLDARRGNTSDTSP